ncbi:MAG: CpXC domain-containing protein [Anaerolineae bacterium]
MIPTLPVQVNCPNCGTKYVAQVQSIVDVGQDPRLKALLLRGQLNTVICPSCGTPGVVNAPLLYHDPEKELLLLFIPPELNLPMAERERLTGNLVNALMSIVPPEERKGYFLSPRTVLTRQSLIDEILEADGVTREMIEKQRAKNRLLQDLLNALDDEEQLQALIEQNKANIDYPFLLILAAAAESSAIAGQQQVTEKLLQLRDVLLERVPIVLPEPLPMDTPPAEVVDKLMAAKDKETRWALVVYNRPLLDYAFFQELTRRIEKAAPEKAEALRGLRDELLEMTEQLDREAQAVRESKIQLLQEALSSPDPAGVLREKREELDALFLAILGTALRNAQQEGSADEAKRLAQLNEVVRTILQEELPAELRLVNELVSTNYPEGTQKLLEERRAEWGENFLEILQALAEDLEAQERTEVAQRLRDIQAQAETILHGLASQHAGP